MSRQERLDWACPPGTGGLAQLDREEEDSRVMLIQAEHPEYEHAIRTGREIEVGGQTVNPTVHIAMHGIIVNQILENDPPETWETAQRLENLGYGRHDVIHMLGSAISTQIWGALEGAPPDPEAYKTALAGLPESWEALREDGGSDQPANRPGNRIRGRHRRR